MKLCYAVHDFALGGMEQHTLDLARGMKARGHDVHLLTLRRDGGHLAPVLPGLRAAGIAVTGFPLVDPRSFGERLGARRQLRAWLRRERFDVFHLQRYNPYHSHWLPLIARLAGVPVRVVSEQDPGLEFGSPNALVGRLGDAFVTGWIVASSFSERELKAKTPRPAARIFRLPLGIPTEHHPRITPERRAAARTALGLAPDALVAGTVCRLVNLKGIDDLFDALPPVLARYPQLQVLVAGTGPERERLNARAAQLGPNVRLLGRVEDAAAFVAALDVFAFPSRYEGFGLAVAEAMSAGLPVVGTKVGALEEMVVESGGGRSVAPQDHAAFGAALAELLADPAERARCGAAGSEYAHRMLSIEGMLERFEKLYAKLRAES